MIKGWALQTWHPAREEVVPYVERPQHGAFVEEEGHGARQLVERSIEPRIS